MIEHKLSNRIRPLPIKGSGHAIGKSYYNFGVSGGDCRFIIRIQLGRPCTARLLSATWHSFTVMWRSGPIAPAFADHASDCPTVKRSR